MTWLEEWRGLAARIDGLLRAAEFLASTFRVSTADNFSVLTKSLQPALATIIKELDLLKSTSGEQLPPKALEALLKFVALRSEEGFTGQAVFIQRFAFLASFRSEFEYLLRDIEEERRSLSELAFEHLRRQLVVDSAVRKKWQAAFKHETACEKLGAVHLLSHGIWAFKVLAPGSATDLVYGDPIMHGDKRLKRTARALVLTEWKRFMNAGDMETKAVEAREQTKFYSGGVLGDVELKQTRYIVLVGKLDLPAPDDLPERGITYRHIILPVEAEVPSKAAKKRKPSTSRKR